MAGRRATYVMIPEVAGTPRLVHNVAMRRSNILLLFFAIAPAIVAAEDDTCVWRLRDAWEGLPKVTNPLADLNGDPVWHFLRTTRSEGPITTRVWHRDGRYVPLVEHEVRLFGEAIEGWVFKPSKESPLVGRVTGAWNHGRQFELGEAMIAPGPEHAVVVAWQSPVAATIDIEGFIEHAQTCCGINSQINWYVERGPAPNMEAGFKPTLLASGHSDYGTETQKGTFKLKGLCVEPDDWFYFIVDARADGTASPHHGDGSAIDVKITAHGVKPFVPPGFEKDIRPILASACFDCHGEDTQEGQLDVRTVTSILQGGENGHALIRGEPGRSLLLDMIVRKQMPPGADQTDGDAKPLTSRQIALIRRWIKAGAPAAEKVVELPPRTQITDEDRSFWAFQRPLKQALPKVKAAQQVTTPVDRFLLKRLEAKGLTYSPEADKATLLRRAYFALIGLPPTPEQLDEFMSDDRPDAWEQLIDRLLASPQYGERWGRHWLDAVGYVDNRLFDGDLASIYPNENIWRYRDYVIRSLNQDKPYDRFLAEQLAGDELVDWRNAESFDDATRDLLIATGFYRSIEDHTSEAQYGIAKRYEVVFDTMSMLSTSLMGLTLECSRCHNHKFDPIPQRDYYRLMATIEPALNPHNWRKPQDRWLADVSPAERQQIDAHNADVGRRVGDLNNQIKAAAEAKDEAKAAELNRQVAELNGTKRSYGKIQALFDVSADRPQSRLLRRGLATAPGVLVEPGFLQVLSAPSLSRAMPSDDVRGETTGMRLSLARWLTGREHPLTARVIVNRVWHHHFGRGIVATPGNFGRSGSLPTHPELLDWLAVDFMEHGWSLKRLHRQIATSMAFRQSSAELAEGGHGDIGRQQDPENQLLWRMPLRRLESEIIRDSVLAASGQLDATAGGPPVMITKPSDGLSREERNPTPTSHLRRSLYLFARRVYPLKFLEVFDSPIVPINCTQRMQSATVLQSFTQLNDEFVLEHAGHLAARLPKDASCQDQVRSAWRIVLAREARSDELERAAEFVELQTQFYAQSEGTQANAPHLALKDLCHMLLCTNEFLYVE